MNRTGARSEVAARKVRSQSAPVDGRRKPFRSPWAGVMALQRSAGNQVVTQLLSSGSYPPVRMLPGRQAHWHLAPGGPVRISRELEQPAGRQALLPWERLSVLGGHIRRNPAQTIALAQQSAALLRQDLRLSNDTMLKLDGLATPQLDAFIVSYRLGHFLLGMTLRSYAPSGGIPGSIAQIATSLSTWAIPGGAYVRLARIILPPSAGAAARHDRSSRAAAAAAQVGQWLQGTTDPLGATIHVLKALRSINTAEREIRSDADERLASLDDAAADPAAAALSASQFLTDLPTIRSQLHVAIDAMNRLVASYSLLSTKPAGPEQELSRLLASVGPDVLTSLRGSRRQRFYRNVLVPRFPELDVLTDPATSHYTKVMSIAELSHALGQDSEVRRFIERQKPWKRQTPQWRFDYRGEPLPFDPSVVPSEVGSKPRAERIMGWLQRREEQRADVSLRTVKAAIAHNDSWVHEPTIVFSARSFASYERGSTLDTVLADAADVMLQGESRQAHEHWGRLAGILP